MTQGFRKIVALASLAGPLLAQHVVGARPGLCSFVRGDVSIAGNPVQPEDVPRRFVDPGQTLETGSGLAEVQLGALSVIRAGAQSELLVVSGDHESVVLELRGGSAILDLRDRFERQRVTVRLGEAAIETDEVGVYRFDDRAGRSPRVKVYDGSARAEVAGKTVNLGAGKSLRLKPGSIDVRSFNKKRGDKLDAWATERRELFARQAPGKKRKRRRGGLILR